LRRIKNVLLQSTMLDEKLNHLSIMSIESDLVFFRHYFRVSEKKSVKNVLLKHFLHSFINSKHFVFSFMFVVLVFVKQQKLVLYIVWIESIFFFILFIFNS